MYLSACAPTALVGFSFFLKPGASASAAQVALALSVKTFPNKLPELLINLLRSQAPQLPGATPSAFLRAVHPASSPRCSRDA